MEQRIFLISKFSMSVLLSLFLARFAISETNTNVGLSDAQIAHRTAARTTFLRQFHTIDLAEIKVGKLAQEKGQSEIVKRFATMLVTEHTETEEQIARQANHEGIELNPQNPELAIKDLNKKLDRVYLNLKDASPAAFDTALARQMVGAHQDAIQLVKNAEVTFQGDQPYLLLAETILPTLERHRDMAEKLLSRKFLGE